MLTTQQMRRIAEQSGARDVEKVGTDIILTYLLQLFHDKGITGHIAFKDGTLHPRFCPGGAGQVQVSP